MKLTLIAMMLGTVQMAAAVPMYTNTWANSQGTGVVKNWNDAVNWTVDYAGDTPAPASAVPTADSLAKFGRSASITLQNGDDLEVGSTRFGADDSGKTISLTIPAGATLSCVGTDNYFMMGNRTDGWMDGSVNNTTLIDVAGGTLNLGLNYFSMRPNQTASRSTGYNILRIGNGGTVNVTSGTFWMYGGESAQSTGAGSGTNIVEVNAGGLLKFSGNARLQLGNYKLENTPNAYSSAGSLLVKGGKVDFTDCTPISHDSVIKAGCNKSAAFGSIVEVSDGGEIDFGGFEFESNTQNTNILRATSGGVVKNLGDFQASLGGYQYASYHNMIEVDGGTVELKRFRPGRHQGEGCGGRFTFRIRGWTGRSRLAMAAVGSHMDWYYEPSGTPAYFLDSRLSAHTPRNARFPLAPLAFTNKHYNTDSSGTTKIRGVNRISPDGGFQLVHATNFVMVARNHDGGGNFTFGNSFKLIGEEMWTTNNCMLTIGSGTDAEVEALVGYGYAYAFRPGLRAEARLASGVSLANPVARGWLTLPKFGEKDLNPEKTERVSVRLALEAPEGGTLDLDKVVANMTAAGQAAVKDGKVSPYNVRVDLPMDELAVNVSNDHVVMDFVEVNDYPQATGMVPFTTNAVIRAVSCEVNRLMRGTWLIFR